MTNQTPPAATMPVCRSCGSADVTRDATAAWCIETQSWTLAGTYDSTTCQSCEAESDTLADWIPVTENAVLEHSAAGTTGR